MGDEMLVDGGSKASSTRACHARKIMSVRPGRGKFKFEIPGLLRIFGSNSGPITDLWRSTGGGEYKGRKGSGV